MTVAVGRLVYWNSHHISEYEKLHKAVFYDYKEPLSCQINKIVAELSDSETAAEIANRNHCRLQSYRGENWYAFLPEKSGKIQAIHELANLCQMMRMAWPIGLKKIFLIHERMQHKPVLTIFYQ